MDRRDRAFSLCNRCAATNETTETTKDNRTKTTKTTEPKVVLSRVVRPAQRAPDRISDLERGNSGTCSRHESCSKTMYHPSQAHI